MMDNIVQGESAGMPDWWWQQQQQNNPISLLGGLSRIARIFGQPQTPNSSPDPGQVMNNTIPADASNSSTSQIPSAANFTPDNTISSQYSNQLQGMPDRSNYNPSFLRRLGGALTGLSTVGPATYDKGAALGFKNYDPKGQSQITDQFDYKPYYQDMNDWQNKTKALQAGATEEDKRNSYGMLRGIQRDKLDETKRADQAREANNTAKTQISADRAKAYEFDKMNPTWKPFIQPGGNLIYINPKDPTQTYDTGLDSGKLTDEDKINLTTQGRLQGIAAQGKNQLNLEGARETANQSDIAARGTQTRQTNAEKPVSGSKSINKPMTTAQMKARALEGYNTHPDWQKYIDPTTGTVKFSGDEALDSQIHSFIYGRDVSLPTDNSQPNDAQPVSNSNPAEEKRIRVQGPNKSDGTPNYGTVPASQADKLPAGWKVVK